jgi:hypothetical protein
MVVALRTLTAAAAMAGAPALLQTSHTATLILVSSERVTGLVAYSGEVAATPASRTFHIQTPDGHRLTIAFADVAVIDFSGGKPTSAELDALGADTPHVMTLRNGNSRSGRLIGIVGGEFVRWESQTGSRVDVPIRNVTRIYLNQDRALEQFGFEPPSRRQPGGLAGWIGRGWLARYDVIVDASIAWVDAGFTVQRGDRLRFAASGAIKLSRTPGDTTGPAGRATLRRERAPLPDVPVGALIARIGDGVFSIGAPAEPVSMPVSGRLQLGVNDDTLSNNSGSYRVRVEIVK